MQHPLRKFGVNFTVAVTHHTKDNTQRKMVVYRDSTKFLKFVEWAQKVLYDKVPKPSKDELTFMYVDELGVTRDIKSMDDLDAWLDVMWYKHPPELIVTDIDALMYKAEIRSG